MMRCSSTLLAAAIVPCVLFATGCGASAQSSSEDQIVSGRVLRSASEYRLESTSKVLTLRFDKVAVDPAKIEGKMVTLLGYEQVDPNRSSVHQFIVADVVSMEGTHTLIADECPGCTD